MCDARVSSRHGEVRGRHAQLTQDPVLRRRPSGDMVDSAAQSRSVGAHSTEDEVQP